MLWKEYIALAIFPIWLLAIGAGAHKQGTVTVEPVHTRSFKDILQELIPPTPDTVTGIIIMLDGMTLTLRRKDGTLALVEFLTAAKSPEFPPIGTGKTITCMGKTDESGILHAYSIRRADQ